MRLRLGEGRAPAPPAKAQGAEAPRATRGPADATAAGAADAADKGARTAARGPARDAAQRGGTGASARRSPRRKPRRPGGRGTLFLVASFFLASAVLRVGENVVSGAIPETVSGLVAGWAVAQQTEPGTNMAADPAQGWEMEPDYLLAALAEREATLSAREAALEERLQTLQMAEGEFEENMAALLQAEEALRATLTLADGAAQADLDRLTRVYENMKPKDASALFAEMDPSFAAGFLGQMNPTAAAAIMAGLPPETAYTVSLVLASRNMEVPR
ncbi:MAG: hypothetical protein AAFU80_04980 [Pseudomonadota bacterium]